MCIEKSALQRRLLEEIGELPAWYDVEGIEQFCATIAAAVIAEIAVPDGVDITPLVTVYDDGEALLVFVAQVEGYGDQPVVLARAWLNLREQGVEEVIGEVEEMRGEMGRRLRGIAISRG